ncbi:cytochrome b5 domain-containing protein [Bacillus marinisedimentorum]|uniref:cytochrome b5 domain-containing protein n=1 Tax=Bacillus marinisedimentorum TaxID=1821260 RepID=UPI0007E12B35|nr:cytochrome b5 domain-containing protein [Bacillus marinisedimentorum]
MRNVQLLRLQLNHLVSQARHDIYTLSSVSDEATKRQLLQRLWDALSTIHFLSELLADKAQTAPLPQQQAPQPQPIQPAADSPQIPPITPLPGQSPPQQPQRTFSAAELATFDGKNGRPAYVAVNGTVYDVTNNRAWAAATHFALTAGKDYTKEFASCHAGQQSILATLPIVGRLV